MFRRTLEVFTETLTSQREPHQVALGISLGVAIGLIPKTNLIAAVLIVLLFAMRTNLAAALITCAITAWVGIGLDPLSHWLGERILTSAALQPLLATLYQSPFAPWTSFHNTIVMGTTVLGLTQLPFTYLWVRRLMRRRMRGDSTEPKPITVPRPKFQAKPKRPNRRLVIGTDAS